MYLDETPDQRAFRHSLREYLTSLMSTELEDEVRSGEGGGPLYRATLRRLGADGWLGLGWPREYGGQGRSAVDELIFFDEVQRAGFPIPFLTLCTVGPTLARFGTPAQKERFVPPILRGEMHFAIGYSEPGAGTDLASLQTRATREGDHYRIQGQKVFTSQAEYADYIWLAVRTDPNASKHKGISILMVPTDAAGFSLTPTWTMGGVRTNTTYYEDVRVPVDNLVLGENQGWKLITNQLNHERVALSPSGPLARYLEEVLAWARETTMVQGRVIDRPWVQRNLARVHAKLAALKLMNWQQATAITRGGLLPAQASGVKVFASELYVEAYQLLLEVLGCAGTLRRGSPGALIQGRLERYYRSTLILTFGGGTNEIQRDIIATTGLGMPRAPR